MNLISLKNISKSYTVDKSAIQVLDNINLQLEQGSFTSILGTSGSGKSTLLNILGCLDEPSSGNYIYNDQDVSKIEPSKLSELRRDNFGFIFQSFNLIPRLNVLENVARPLFYSGISRSVRNKRAYELLEQSGLQDRLEHMPSQLSGGQKQRVAIARALINKPKLILADEPTGNLDSENTIRTLDILKKLNNDGNTIVMITHDMQIAEQTNKILYLNDGVLSETNSIYL